MKSIAGLIKKHLFSGNPDVSLAILKIQVLPKLMAKGILGCEQPCQMSEGKQKKRPGSTSVSGRL
jgi:hypothetical protein